MDNAIKTGDRVVLAAIDSAEQATGSVRDVDGNRVLVRTDDGGTEWVDARLVSVAVTDSDIEQLSEEAGAAGDSAQLALCTAALAGDDVARAECERVILTWRREAGIRAEEDAVSAEALEGISPELVAGISAYNARIAALGGYGARVRAVAVGAAGALITGRLGEAGFGGIQPMVTTEDGRRFSVQLDTAEAVAPNGEPWGDVPFGDRSDK